MTLPGGLWQEELPGKPEVNAPSPHRGNPVRRAATILLLVAMSTVGPSCVRKAGVPSDTGDSTKEASPVASPCSLLDATDLELALNITLPSAFSVAEGPQAGRPILAGMQMCTVAYAGSVASWGLLSKGAGRLFRTYREWNGSEVTETTVAGQEAIWDGGLRTLIVLAGDRAFGVRLTVKDPPLGKATDAQAYAQQATKRLATVAVRRLPR